MTSLSSQSLIPTLQIQRIQHLQASLHLFLYYCQLNAPHLTIPPPPPPPPPPPRPLPPGPSRQIRKFGLKQTRGGGEHCVTPARAAANCGFVAKYTAILRKVVGKNVYPTIPKGNVGYDQYTVPDTVAVDGTYFSCFPNLALANSYFHGLSCHSFKFL